jgi:p-aminobenzoyl-glutamate transporter AbgT
MQYKKFIFIREATVITNLLSAIPWIGNDFVEFILFFILKLYIYLVVAVLFLKTIGVINLRGLRGQKVKSDIEKQYALDIPYFNTLPNTAEGYTLLPFFLNWIIGFTIAEGSFFNKNNGDFCFSLTQRSHYLLFEAFKLVFNTIVKVYKDSDYDTFSVSSKKDV